eukprot:comp19701_c0_seq2/m.23428 comp19701_c0_seq2/g.23428  ORF comp19701_c0_seq2/g.23428 comp19701_c0_seq2/m.23428 type:complete len:474 (-) comp19701_c0_seq2:707-2128(-)
MENVFASVSPIMRLPSFKLDLQHKRLSKRGWHANFFLVARSIGIGVLICTFLALLENGARVSIPRDHDDNTHIRGNGGFDEFGARVVHTHGIAARAIAPVKKVSEDSSALVGVVREVARTVDHVNHVPAVPMTTTATHTQTRAVAPDTPVMQPMQRVARPRSENLGVMRGLVRTVLGQSDGPGWGKVQIDARKKEEKENEREVHAGVQVEGLRGGVPQFGQLRNVVRSPGTHEKDGIRYAIHRTTQAAKDQVLRLCPEDMFLYKLVEDFDASRQEFCSPKLNENTDLNPETIEHASLNSKTNQTTSLIYKWTKQHPNSPHPWNIWLAHNVSLFGRGDNLSLVADCNPIGAFIPDEPSSDWSVHPATATLLANTVARDGALAGTCTQWVDGTLLLVDLYDWNNMFHFFEEFSALFAAMAVLQSQMEGDVQGRHAGAHIRQDLVPACGFCRPFDRASRGQCMAAHAPITQPREGH